MAFKVWLGRLSPLGLSSRFWVGFCSQNCPCCLPWDRCRAANAGKSTSNATKWALGAKPCHRS
eukprot:15465057-Alexandrium_andersonii.AAC.1